MTATDQTTTRENEQKWFLLMLALILLAFAVRIHQLDAFSLWFDEASTARNLVIPFKQVVAEAQSLGHGPYYLLLKLFPHLEQSEFSLRYPSVLFGALGVAAIFAAGRRLGGVEAGILAALLLSLSPMHIWYSREARTYSWTLAASLLASVAFLDLQRRTGRLAWGRLVAAQAVTIYAHLFAGLTNVWQTLFAFVSIVRGRAPWKLWRWLAAQAVVLLMVIPTIVMALWSAGQKEQISWLPAPARSAPIELTMHLSGVRYLGQHGWWWIVWLTWLALIVWGVIRLQPKIFTPGEGRLFLLAWAVVPAAILLIVTWTWKPVYLHRYTLFTLPPWLLLIGSGIANSRRNGLVLLSVVIVLSGQVFAVHDMLNSPFYAQPDWRTTQRHLAALIKEGDLALFHPWLLKRPFDYYNAKQETIPESQLDTVGVPQGAETVTSQVLTEKMKAVEATVRAGNHRLWVVERWSDAASKWLDEREGWRQVRKDEFVGDIQVFLYVFEGDR